MGFSNKKVIVTGAGRSMGRQMAVDFAKQGADVVISYRGNEAGALETVAMIKQLGQKTKAIKADFSDLKEIKRFAEEAISFLGGIDVLVNNAGVLCRETFFELEPEVMQHTFQLNSVAPLYLARLCAENMRDNKVQGSIVNISSIGGSSTGPRGIGYAASKAAMNKWTQNAAKDLAQYRIRVNTVSPGVIEAGMNQNTERDSPEVWQRYLSMIPLGRVGTPEDIANMVLFLASEKASWITGKIIEVDGGHVL